MGPRFITRPWMPIFLGIGLLAVAGCQTTPSAPSPTSMAAEKALPPLNTAGASHYRLRAELSDVRFLVYKAGALSAFGHNHVIQAKSIHGDIYLAKDFQQSGFELTLPVKDFEVDAPAARSAEGADFASQPSPQAVEGTHQNMLGAAELDVARYPDIHLRSVVLTGPDWGPDLTVRITLHGVERDVTLPVSIEHCDDQLVVVGAFDVLQSDFGIRPLSLFGGGLQVADRVRIRFRLVASPDAAQPQI